MKSRNGAIVTVYLTLLTIHIMNKSSFVLTLLVIALIGALGYLVYDKVLYAPSTPPTVVVVNPTTTEPVVCTMDAKLCPDGSYVGRTGPKCEFAACPTPTTNTSTIEIPDISTWLTVTNTAITFKYPARIPTTYIRAEVWPPTASVDDGNFSCATQAHAVNGRAYCVKETTEGAAGSIYVTYAYTFNKGKQMVTFTFVLKETQCGNYNEPEKAACEAERQALDVDKVVDAIAQTVTLK